MMVRVIAQRRGDGQRALGLQVSDHGLLPGASDEPLTPYEAGQRARKIGAWLRCRKLYGQLVSNAPFPTP
jgi:hypothetical protein